MTNTKFLLLASTCLLLSGNSQASEVKNLTFGYSGSPLVKTHTTHIHTPYELKPISSLDNTFRITAVCAVGGGRCAGLTFGSSGNSMSLDEDFQCKDEEYVKTCPEGQVPDENKLCPHNKSYFKCRQASDECDEKYSLKECSSDQVQINSYINEAGNTCIKCRDKTCYEGGYVYQLTECKNGIEISFANKTCYINVTAKNCEDGGYQSSCPTNQVGTSVSYCGNTCYSDCKQPVCEDGGYLSNTPVNNICEDITYYGQTCKTNCKQPNCSDGGYKNDIPTNNVCTQVDYYGTKCFDNCYQPTCDNGGYKDAVPANQTCTPVTYYGRNCFKDCYQPQCTSGGYVDACPANQIGTSVTYYGRNCYKNCYQPQCSDGGYQNAQPSGQSCDQITYYGRNCYKDCKTMIITASLPILYSDKTISNNIISNKTPIGIVFDETKSLALALENSPTNLTWGGYRTDNTSLENCNNGEPLSCGTDGKANTKAIITFGKTNNISYPAAEYCNNYITAGTSAEDWHLPSYAELKSIYNNKSTINATLNLLGKSPFKEGEYYWSSTERSTVQAWQLGISTGREDYPEKDSYYPTRPVIAFNQIAETEMICKIGSILYQDLKCYVKTKKTPIGVIFDTNKHLAIALENAPGTWAFGGEGIDIPNLSNCDDDEPVSCGTDGKANTEAIITFGKTNNISYPAAEYCNNYTTVSTKAGDWFLPSYTELKSIYDEKNAINATLSSLGKSAIPEDEYTLYWSSTETNSDGSWGFNMKLREESLDPFKNENEHYVRPVIQYSN